MGMYTQAKGMLNVASIGREEEFEEIFRKVERTKLEFHNENLVDRTWVCDSTVAVQGGNGSVFIFFGTELKNYSSEIETWITYLLNRFPTAEGKFDIQYEECECPTTYFIYKGKIVKVATCEVEQNGYGNGY